MNAPYRSALLIAATVIAVSHPLTAQRTQHPGPDTKKALVTAFRGDVEGGVKTADEIRNRIQGAYSIKVLMPISKRNIDTALAGSGFRPDSALSPNDIRELAKLLSADEVIDGVVTKTTTGYRVSARMFLPRDQNMSQPLVTVESKAIGDIARQVVDEYDKARKQIPDNQACENGLRASDVPQAIAAARKGMIAYPKSTLLRLCIAKAFAFQKTTADSTGPWKDSLIAVTKSVLDLDKTSNIALRLQYDAYKGKGDTTNALATLIALMNSDPNNATLTDQVIVELVTSGKAEMAVPIVKQLVAVSPGDPGPARTYWQVLRATKNYKESVPAGIALVSIDSALADSGYYDRQIQDLTADSAYAKVVEMASMAAARYPTNTRFLLVKAQNERRAGKLDAAKASLQRAVSIDPNVNGPNYLLAQIASDQGNTDDVLKFARADAAQDAANKERAGNLVLAVGRKIYDAAGAAKSAAEFKRAIPILQASDDLHTTPTARFLIGVSGFQFVHNSADGLQKSRKCEEYKEASDMLSLAALNVPKNGHVSPEAAGVIMGAIPQYQPFVDGGVKRYCKQ